MMIKKRDQKRQPAWVDKALDDKVINIEDTARLRKLKKTEGEQEIKASVFQDRLQDQYRKLVGEGEDQ